MSHSRRRVLKASAVALSGAGAGAFAASSTAQQARAAEVDLSVTGDEVEIREATIAAVWLEADIEWSYEVPSEESPATLVVDLLAGTSEDSMSVVESTESDQVFLSAGESESLKADLLEADTLAADDLVPSEGGATTETTVHVGVDMRLLDDSGLTIAADSKTDTASVSVTKSDYDPTQYGSVSGSGELTIELE